jgi:hypothetical protein
MSVGVIKLYARQALRPAETLSVSSTLELRLRAKSPRVPPIPSGSCRGSSSFLFSVNSASACENG